MVTDEHNVNVPFGVMPGLLQVQNTSILLTTAPISSPPLKSIKIKSDAGQAYSGYLVIHDLDEFGIPTSYGKKLALPGPFKSTKEASAAGEKLYERFLKGEIVSARPFTEKEKLRDYQIMGKARFDADREGWEPMLELKRIEEPNKGTVQVVAGRASVFGRNLCPTEERAVRFAIETGRSMVISRSGLEFN